MMFHNIHSQVKLDRAMDAVAAGTGDTQNGDVIDTAHYESILFAVYFGVITATAVTTIKVQEGNASDGSDMADIANSSVSVPDTGDSKLWLSYEIHRPTKRYLRVTVTRATANAVINGAFVMLARGGFLPPAQGANAGNVCPGTIVSP